MQVDSLALLDELPSASEPTDEDADWRLVPIAMATVTQPAPLQRVTDGRRWSDSNVGRLSRSLSEHRLTGSWFASSACRTCPTSDDSSPAAFELLTDVSANRPVEMVCRLGPDSSLPTERSDQPAPVPVPAGQQQLVPVLLATQTLTPPLLDSRPPRIPPHQRISPFTNLTLPPPPPTPPTPSPPPTPPSPPSPPRSSTSPLPPRRCSRCRCRRRRRRLHRRRRQPRHQDLFAQSRRPAAFGPLLADLLERRAWADHEDAVDVDLDDDADVDVDVDVEVEVEVEVELEEEKESNFEDEDEDESFTLTLTLSADSSQGTLEPRPVHGTWSHGRRARCV
ncbi:unnamed protein product [Protopolystoma xenopodis]|uniref:Uncharacterized protein n=1 Tax=Protopolystoma xenopodis TaxID=117903 RepID=A0A448XS40_9PLAT|nr:unnamed protein product [Protopolystoma xenopodis]